ncbi:MAG: flagellar biosynthesis protein FlhB [Saccharospirillaceae bacterium]|nr:flagellar biosynthesis protein FlhB [Pseudomonadales bacterium]NRB77856.1 flagellar biosynthesis protein FlhB [Saccharospirillaceae bacterium]
MSEDSSQEKTEEPTEKKKEKARKDGQVPRSRELNTAVLLTASALSFIVFGPGLVRMARTIFETSFSFDRRQAMDTDKMGEILGASVFEALWGIMPILIILLIASILGPIGLGGWNMAMKTAMPKASRMNPIAGIKKMFSMNSLVELLKSWLKVIGIGGCAVLVLMAQFETVFNMTFESTLPALKHALNMLLWSFLLISLFTWVLVAIDVPFQIYQNAKKLKMSLQEIKEEYKSSEGNQEIKAKIKQIQREMSQRRMMTDMPEADVVITNPEHYSVALRYDPQSMDVPILVAKGVDQMAMKIREVANEYDIPIIQMPPLARSIYHFTDIGQEVPEGLYVAIAQVLAYVYQMDQYQKGQGQKPKLQTPDVPDDLRFDGV